ncbi:hypothetical protein LTR36_000523 [Oleoguttula mirabilis]|uniref:Uncharacterized protein n=1 Tax=Oleoguttula mirabilis TaxID=1507867 RepID=A0AAV9JQ62_9PEZI|nr:hypothetical protein LTR36_000523 [Oleoguttula mirabilis]
MSTFRDSPMADQLSQADVILNRTNVALARSQRLIQSWLPIKPPAEAESSAEEQGRDEKYEEDFVGLDELGGLGSKRKADDEGLPDGAFRRKKLASNEKLLEQLLGKKAAQARKKGLGLDARMPGVVGLGHAAAKQMPARARRDAAAAADSEEEEEGRTASFKSRSARGRPMQAPPVVAEPDVELETLVEAGSVQDAVEAAPAEPVAEVEGGEAEEEEERPMKKKAGSYLDEVLGQNAKKKKNKKKKNDSSATAQQ